MTVKNSVKWFNANKKILSKSLGKKLPSLKHCRGLELIWSSKIDLKTNKCLKLRNIIKYPNMNK